MALDFPDISKNLFDLRGYCSVETGAGQGIGLALSKGFAHAGSDLVLVDMNPETLTREHMSTGRPPPN